MDEPQTFGLAPHRARHGQVRCERCALPPNSCLCGEVEPLTLATRVVVVMHRREVHKTTNTVRLVPLTLVNSQVRVIGLPHERAHLDGLAEPGQRVALLFPGPDARVLTAEDAREPLTLVVPDGNWRQAHKFATKEPQLAALPRVQVPKHPDPRYLATFEAIARALGVLEGDAVRERLERVLELKVQRTLRLRPYG
jgi:DTW domain-containing protein YfiP